jgi:integral membrane protein
MTDQEPPVDRAALQRLRTLGTVEGCSTLLLFFVAMPLKYLAGYPLAVTLVGALHGVLFVGLCLLLALGVARVPLPRELALLGMLAAIVPFGPFLYDRKLRELDRAALPPDAGAAGR